MCKRDGERERETEREREEEEEEEEKGFKKYLLIYRKRVRRRERKVK